MSGEQKTWNNSYALMRVLACLGIVLLHTANVSELLYPEASAQSAPGFAMDIVYSMMWAVPCFLMVSGALLLDPEREISVERIRDRYLKRIALALLLCCLLFAFFDSLMDGTFSLLFLADGIYRLFTGGSWAHLWYLYLLLGLYLMLPFYRMITKHSDDTLLRYLLLLYAAFLSVFPALGIFGIDIAFSIQTAGIYPFYFFAGYAIASEKVEIPTRVLAMMAIFATLAIWSMNALRGWQQFPLSGQFSELLGSYASPLVAIQSIGIFGLIRRVPVDSFPYGLGDCIRWIDACTFGAYLFHMILLRFCLRYLGWDLFVTGIWSIFVFAAGAFLLSVAGTFVLKKVPYLRDIL